MDSRDSKKIMDGATLCVCGSKIDIKFNCMIAGYAHKEIFDYWVAQIKCKYPYAVLKGTISISDFKKLGLNVPKEELYAGSPHLNFYIFIVEPKHSVC